MTEDEAIAKWDETVAPILGDRERAHVCGDAILVEALRALGWDRLADRWEKDADEWWWA